MWYVYFQNQNNNFISALSAILIVNGNRNVLCFYKTALRAHKNESLSNHFRPKDSASKRSTDVGKR